MTANGVLLTGTPIAIDYWRERRCNYSKLFFLSHYHADHMEGLNSSWSSKIYCSKLTATLLIDEMKIQHDLVTPLEIGQPHIIAVDEIGCETMTVTLLDANHCPGAVMFVFEGYFGCIFYTGDFRYDDQLILQPAFPQGKQIDQLFIDNTYCNPKAQFPTRKQAFDTILKIIQRHPGSTIVIGMMHIGKEELLEDLAKELQTMIVVDSKRLQRLQLLQRLNVFTDQLDMGRIIVKYKNDINDTAIERWNQQFGPTIAIIPTALYIYQDRPPVLDKRIYVVHYSDHSNYDELRRFVNIVKPCRIIPIVKHIPDTVLGQSWNDMKCFDDLRHPSQPLTVTVPISVTQFMYGYHRAGMLARNSTKMDNTSKRKNTTSGSRKKSKHGGIVYVSSSLEENQSSIPATDDDITSSTDATIHDKKAQQAQQIETLAKMNKEDDIVLDYALQDQVETVIKTLTLSPLDHSITDCPDSITRNQEETKSSKDDGNDNNMTTMVITTTKTSPLNDSVNDGNYISSGNSQCPPDIVNSQKSMESSNISSNSNNCLIATSLTTMKTSSPASNNDGSQNISDDDNECLPSITTTSKNIQSISNHDTATTLSSMTKASVLDHDDNSNDNNNDSKKCLTGITKNPGNSESLENDSFHNTKNITAILFTDVDTDENMYDSPKDDHPLDINTMKVSQHDSNNAQIESLSQQSSHYSNSISHIDQADYDNNKTKMISSFLLLDSNSSPEELMNKEDSSTGNVSTFIARDTIGKDCNNDAKVGKQDTCGTPVPVHIDELTMPNRANHNQHNDGESNEKVISSETDPDYKQDCDHSENEKLISLENAQDFNQHDDSEDEISNSCETDQDKCVFITPPTTNDLCDIDDSTLTICSDNDITDIQSINDNDDNLSNISNDQVNDDSPFCKALTEEEWSKFLHDTFLNKKVKPIDIMSYIDI